MKMSHHEKIKILIDPERTPRASFYVNMCFVIASGVLSGVITNFYISTKLASIASALVMFLTTRYVVDDVATMDKEKSNG